MRHRSEAWHCASGGLVAGGCGGAPISRVATVARPGWGGLWALTGCRTPDERTSSAPSEPSEAVTPDAPTATPIDTGAEQSCGLRNGRTIQCWGAKFFGQLGNGTNTPSSVPASMVGF